MSTDVQESLAPLLELASTQLEVAVQNAESQAATLADAVGEIATLAAALRSSAQDTALAQAALRLAEHAQSALVAMQFHDQLAQRILHVRDALGLTQRTLAEESPPDWERLFAAIRARYTMEDERRLFDLVAGNALGAGAHHDANHEALRGSVELF